MNVSALGVIFMLVIIGYFLFMFLGGIGRKLAEGDYAQPKRAWFWVVVLTLSGLALMSKGNVWGILLFIPIFSYIVIHFVISLPDRIAKILGAGFYAVFGVLLSQPVSNMGSSLGLSNSLGIGQMLIIGGSIGLMKYWLSD